MRRFADIGYVTIYEDIVYESSWKDYYNYYESVGREDITSDDISLAFPKQGVYEFGDSAVVGTIQNSNLTVTRTVYLGEFTYSETGQLLGKNLSGQYIWTYGSEYGSDASFSHYGLVRSFNPGFYFDMLNYAEYDKKFDDFLDSEHTIHEFESDEDESEWHGLGRNAFSDPAVSKYFQEGWHLNPFGNDFNSSKSSVYRLFNQNSGRYLFSSNQVEIDIITGMDWINEGIAYKSPGGNQETTALHRFNTNGNGHFYTANEYEKEILESTTSWTYEGIAFQVYSHEQASSVIGAIPVIRYLNTNSGVHLYSTSSIEQDILNTAPEWLYEGIAWYGDSI